MRVFKVNILNSYVITIIFGIKGSDDFASLKDEGVFTTYHNLYIKLITDSVYVVIFDNQPFVHSNIDDAYQTFITWLAQFSGFNVSSMPSIKELMKLEILFKLHNIFLE